MSAARIITREDEGFYHRCQYQLQNGAAVLHKGIQVRNDKERLSLGFGLGEENRHIRGKAQTTAKGIQWQS